MASPDEGSDRDAPVRISRLGKKDQVCGKDRRRGSLSAGDGVPPLISSARSMRRLIVRTENRSHGDSMLCLALLAGITIVGACYGELKKGDPSALRPGADAADAPAPGVGGNAGGGAGGTDQGSGGTADTSVLMADPPSPDGRPSTDALAGADATETPPPPPGCVDGCVRGAIRCSNNASEKCVVLGSGCAGWSFVEQCPAPQVCARPDQACQCPAPNACSLENATRCEAGREQRCERIGPCLQWSTGTPCSAPKICRGGACECASADCALGSKRCSNGSIQECELEAGCSRWSSPAACPAPRTCVEESGSARCACPATCSVGQRRCDANGDAQECVADNGCPAWRELRKCNNFLCDQGVCSTFECRANFVRCDDGCRPLRGACTVDTEHHAGNLNACTYNSGVRRYTSNNVPADVARECRAMIMDVIRAKCAAQPDGWQASWVAFKGNGFPLTGTDKMFGSCNPTITTQTDDWDRTVETF